MPAIAWPGSLTDGVVVVREPCEADLSADVRAFLDDPTLGATSGLEEDHDVAAAHERVRSAPESRLRGEGLKLTVADAATDAFLGAAGLRDVEWRHRRAEVGVWLTVQARGRGAAQRAVTLIVEWAFAGIELDRLEWTTTPDNEPSTALAARLGFVREGLLRQRDVRRGRRVDILLFGLLRRDWEAQQAERQLT